MSLLFNFSSIFRGGQLTPFAPMCGRPCDGAESSDNGPSLSSRCVRRARWPPTETSPRLPVVAGRPDWAASRRASPAACLPCSPVCAPGAHLCRTFSRARRAPHTPSSCGDATSNSAFPSVGVPAVRQPRLVKFHYAGATGPDRTRADFVGDPHGPTEFLGDPGPVGPVYWNLARCKQDHFCKTKTRATNLHTNTQWMDHNWTLPQCDLHVPIARRY